MRGGTLLSVFGDDVKKYGVELDETEAQKANALLTNAQILAGSVFDLDEAFDNIAFDAVITNPPYSIKWDDQRYSQNRTLKNYPVLPPPSKADYAFLLHALSRVKEGGEVVALMFPGILYRGAREGKIRQFLVEQGYITKVIDVPPNTFEDTSIATVMLVLHKQQRTNGAITFESGEQSTTATFEEIAKNNFCLSPSNYITPPKAQTEDFDLHATEKEVRANLKHHIVNSLTISQLFVTKGLMDAQGFDAFIDDLIQTINNFRQGATNANNNGRYAPL